MRRALVLSLALSLSAITAIAAEPMFTRPLHLTREVADSLAKEPVRIEEYCLGDRIVSIRGSRTSIVDFRTGELTEIDRERGTYSVTRFEEIAKSAPATASARQKGANPVALRDVGSRRVAGQAGFAVQARVAEGESAAEVEVTVSDSGSLSLHALEALLGAAWPMTRNSIHDVAIGASGKRRGMSKMSDAQQEYALPLEQTVRWEVAGERVTSSNRIVRVGSELPPPELIAIPAGAKKVESHLQSRERLLNELDHPPK